MRRYMRQMPDIVREQLIESMTTYTEEHFTDSDIQAALDSRPVDFEMAFDVTGMVEVRRYIDGKLELVERMSGTKAVREICNAISNYWNTYPFFRDGMLAGYMFPTSELTADIDVFITTND